MIIKERRREMITSFWTTIQDIGIFKSICTLAVFAFFIYIFVAGGKGKGGGSSSGTPPTAEG